VALTLELMFVQVNEVPLTTVTEGPRAPGGVVPDGGAVLAPPPGVAAGWEFRERELTAAVIPRPETRRIPVTRRMSPARRGTFVMPDLPDAPR
jgi:hypothetical protein